MASNGSDDRPSAASTTPFLSSTMNDGDDDDGDDIEALASKACALASVPVPDYADAMKRSNARSKKKYGDRFTIGDDDDDAEDDEEDPDTNGIVLAEKTSQILSNFQDYVSGIGGEDATMSILDSTSTPGGGALSRGEESVTFMEKDEAGNAYMASTIRSDAKRLLLEPNKNKKKNSSGSSVGSTGSRPLQREWAYEGYNATTITTENSSRNLHEVGSLGSWDGNDDPEAAMMRQLQRGQKYTHPWLQSRRVKIGLLNCILIAGIIIGVSYGVTSNNRQAKEDLGVRVEELEEELAQGMYDGSDGNPGGGDGGSEKNTEMAPPKKSPPGLGTMTIGIQESISETIVGGSGSDNNSAIESTKATLGEMTRDQQNHMISMMAKYEPKEFDRAEGWDGKTYLEAFDFCGLQSTEKNQYDICPFEAICPLGPDSEPLGGFKEDDLGVMWVPIADNANDWTQISKANSCIKYSSESPNPPEWGLTGQEDGEMTSRVMCCLLIDTLEGESFSGVEGSSAAGAMEASATAPDRAPTAPDNNSPGDDNPDGPTTADPQQYMYQNIMTKFRPREYDRGEGWNGKTYLEAQEFCGQQRGTNNEVYDICSYGAICPLGPDQQPLGGYKENAPYNTWVPLSGRPNDWAQLSKENACTKYSSENQYPPDWGLTGNEDVEWTSHVMCCMADEHVQETVISSISTSSATTTESNTGGVEDLNFELYQSVRFEFLPLEFDRSKGWDGTTYIEALEFCGKTDGYEICPYEAICPLGADSTPMGGTNDYPTGSWAPILDSANDWVQIGPKNKCIKYSAEHPKPPDWSMTGIGNEDITRNLICCLLNGGATEGGGVSMPSIGGSTPMTSDASAGGGDSSAQQQESAYESAAKKYHPIGYSREKGWMGSTYAQARDFCSSKEGYGICSYDAICPAGPDSEPLGGYNNNNMPDGSKQQTWMPISDKINDWVQASEVNPCIKFSAENPGSPDWGLTGDGSEKFTQNIACCLMAHEDDDIGSLQSGYGAELLYKNAALTYQPVEYDRNDWTGQTYVDAMEFCGQHDEKSLCPYKALCPLGANHAPLGGYEDKETWIPILSDEGNDWVQISESNGCIRWSSEHEYGPEWGLTGEGNEKIIQHLSCCLFVDEGVSNVVASGESATPVSTGSKPEESPAQAILDSVEDKVEEAFSTDIVEFLPINFGREDGWTGKTYLEAVLFCADLDDGYEICPYKAICPMGTENQPITGYSGNQDALWAPISDDGNDWVNLSSNNGCTRYTSTHSLRPDWGISGEGSEEITTNLFCCKGSIWGDAEESFMYEMAAKKYHPVSYERESGWTGKTYQDAAEHCGSVTNNDNEKMGLCPFDAICPLADLDAPLGGIRQDPNGSWMPISDGSNEWVSVGPENTCKFYGIVYGKPAELGVAGMGNEDLTQHLACCDTGKTGNEVVTAALPSVPATGRPTPIPTPLPTPLPITLPTPPPTMPPTPLPTMPPTPLPTPLPTLLPTPLPTPLPTLLPTPLPTPLPSNRLTPPPIPGAVGTSVEASKNTEKYNPQLYDRTTGWTGQTYDEAFEFCSGKGPEHDICPYSVICPDGPLKLPYGGSQAEKTSWAPINEPFNSWVLVTEPQVCVKYQNLNPKDHPAWGLTGVGDEDLTRHIMCCEMPDDDTPDNTDQAEDSVGEAYSYVMGTFVPRFFDRADGWDGKTYTDAISFCATQNSYIPCPYEAYCPMGEGSLSSGGFDSTEEAWAPIMDSPNAWVQIGSYQKDFATNSCFKYNDLNDNPPLWGLLGNADEDLTPHIMCCKEKPDHATNGSGPMSGLNVAAKATTTLEQEVLDEMHPVWFGRTDGYHGKTHSDAVDFCKAVGDMALCPRKAYCPSSGSDRPLFLDRDPFDEEQWAPATSESVVEEEYWIGIGEMNTCMTHEEMLLPLPSWAADGSRTELKEHVLCCQNPKKLAKEQEIQKELSPIWMDTSHGWNGGSHDEAEQFCESFGNRKTCPYAVYCPHGPAHAVMGGHVTDFNTEGEQWAPIYGEQKHWVMIGQKYKNRATTCMTSQELEGGMPPDWGGPEADVKKHIMCCSF